MLNAPIAVRVNDGYVDQHVTRHASGLRFTKTAPGGYAYGAVQLNLPRTAFRDLGPADRVWFYDARTGRTLFEGFTQNPGGIDGPAGQGWDLGLLGTMTLANDESQPLLYVDRDITAWENDTRSLPSSSVDVGEWPADPTVSRIRTLFQTGNVINDNDFVRSQYLRYVGIDMKPGAIAIRGLQSGITPGIGSYLCVVTTDIGAIKINFMTTTGTSFTVWADVPGGPGEYWDPASEKLAVQLVRNGGATNLTGASDLYYSDWVGPIVIGRRMDRNGTLLTGPTGLRSATDVYASEVVEDLLGRLFPQGDRILSTVEATDYPIEQLVYTEGATMQRVLGDLALYEPDMLWEVLESTSRGYRFNYRRWPTTSRYEISVADGYEVPGGDADLRNRIRVYWTDQDGREKSVRVTSDTDIGGRWVDDEPIRLPEGLGSEANATKAGVEALAAKASPPKAAKAVVRRRIRDRLRGHDVWPWEIEPGWLVRVRETGDLLRLTQVDYDDDPDPQATLTLGVPLLSQEQRLAIMQRELRRLGGRVA